MSDIQNNKVRIRFWQKTIPHHNRFVISAWKQTNAMCDSVEAPAVGSDDQRRLYHRQNSSPAHCQSEAARSYVRSFSWSWKELATARTRTDVEKLGFRHVNQSDNNPKRTIPGFHLIGLKRGRCVQRSSRHVRRSPSPPTSRLFRREVLRVRLEQLMQC